MPRPKPDTPVLRVLPHRAGEPVHPNSLIPSMVGGCVNGKPIEPHNPGLQPQAKLRQNASLVRRAAVLD